MKILIVEDNQGDFDYISELLCEIGGGSYDIFRSETLQSAEQTVLDVQPDLILLDLGLPDCFGIKTAENMVNAADGIPVIVLTGFENEDVGIEAIKKGAQDFISKNGLTSKYLKKSIIYSLERKNHADDLEKSKQKITYLLDYTSDGVCVVDDNLIIQELNSAFARLFNFDKDSFINQHISNAVSDFKKNDFIQKANFVFLKKRQQSFDYNYDAENEIWYEMKFDPYPNGLIIFVRDISERVSEKNMLNSLNESLKKSTDSTISLLAELVELKEPYTAGHQERVSMLCGLIADEMGLPEKQRQATVMAAKVHDIGKTAIPSEILVKPSLLSNNEMNLVKLHVQSSYNLVKKIHTDSLLSQIVLQHHERINGSGYPKGLKGDEILLEAKILAVADVVDAMLSHRPYRSAYKVDSVIDDLERNKSILYDKDVVKACVQVLKSGQFNTSDM